MLKYTIIISRPCTILMMQILLVIFTINCPVFALEIPMNTISLEEIIEKDISTAKTFLQWDNRVVSDKICNATLENNLRLEEYFGADSGIKISNTNDFTDFAIIIMYNNDEIIAKIYHSESREKNEESLLYDIAGLASLSIEHRLAGLRLKNHYIGDYVYLDDLNSPTRLIFGNGNIIVYLPYNTINKIEHNYNRIALALYINSELLRIGYKEMSASQANTTE